MVGSAFLDSIVELDQRLTLFINGSGGTMLDGFWQMMSDRMVWAPAYVICAYMLFRRLGWKKALIVLASIGLSFAICDQFSNLIKYSVARLRPGYCARMLRDGLILLEDRGGYYGFFSAHAANSFSLAVCMTIGFRNDSTHTYNGFYKGAAGWALLVSISRIFVGKHYLGDVIAGIFIGALVGYFIGMGGRYLIQKYVDKVPATGLSFVLDKKKWPVRALPEPSPSGSLWSP